VQEEERVVVVRFGRDADSICMQMDEVLASVADLIKNFAVVYLVDITEVGRHAAMLPVLGCYILENRNRNNCNWDPYHWIQAEAKSTAGLVLLQGVFFWGGSA
jgi:hypothetical protein